MARNPMTTPLLTKEKRGKPVYRYSFKFDPPEAGHDPGEAPLMGTYEHSKITLARKTHHCQLCEVAVEKGAQQLVYKQGLRSQLYMHLDCALLRFDHYRCRVLEEEADRRIAAGGTCASPCGGFRCCLRPGHRRDHQWRQVQHD